jgi:hypothetical protein
VPPPPSMLSCACCNAVLAAKTFFWFAKKDIVRKTFDGSELLHGGYPVAVETGVIAVAVETGVIAPVLVVLGSSSTLKKLAIVRCLQLATSAPPFRISRIFFMPPNRVVPLRPELKGFKTENF